MENNRIILIGSGIDRNNKRMKDTVLGGCRFYYSLESEKVICDEEYQDEYGQGTNCADIILQMYPKAELYIMKVIGSSNIFVEGLLTEALKKCIDICAKVICIQLSVPVYFVECEEEMYHICEQLKQQGCIICAADNKSLKDSIPARFDNVIGVKSFAKTGDKSIRADRKAKIQVEAAGSPIFVQGIKDRYNFFEGNVKALSYFVGRISAIFGNYHVADFDELLYLLETGDEIYGKEKRLSVKEPVIDNCLYADIVKSIINRISKTEGSVDDTNQEEQFLFHMDSGINFYNFYDLIRELYHKYNIRHTDYHSISYSEVNTVKKLAEHILRECG